MCFFLELGHTNQRSLLTLSLSSLNAAGDRHLDLDSSISSKLAHSCPVRVCEWFYCPLFLLFPKRDVPCCSGSGEDPGVSLKFNRCCMRG